MKAVIMITAIVTTIMGIQTILRFKPTNIIATTMITTAMTMITTAMTTDITMGTTTTIIMARRRKKSQNQM